MSGEDELGRRVAMPRAASKGPAIEAIAFDDDTFGDCTMPGEALGRDEIDAGVVQRRPDLDNRIKQHGYHVLPLGRAGICPTGCLLKTFSSVADLAEIAGRGGSVLAGSRHVWSTGMRSIVSQQVFC